MHLLFCFMLTTLSAIVSIASACWARPCFAVFRPQVIANSEARSPLPPEQETLGTTLSSLKDKDREDAASLVASWGRQTYD